MKQTRLFFRFLQQNNIKHCIHLGDVLDRRKYISYRIAKDFRERFIAPFNHLEVQLHMIVGNHDIYFKNTNDVNSLTELLSDKFDNVHIYAEAQEVDFDGFPILLMPWINPQNEIYALGMMDDTRADTLLGHLEIDGFQMYAGHESQGGLSKVGFQRFETVISGDFHHKSDDGQIFYLGCPYEITWSDYNDPKGFHVFDTETRELHRILNPYKMFSKIYYDDSNENYGEHDVNQYRDQYVKLIVVNKKDLYGFDKFTDRLLQADCHEVKIIEDFSDLDANTVSDDIVENIEDTMTLLGKYIDDLSVNLDKTRLKTMMRSLYTEAQDLEL